MRSIGSMRILSKDLKKGITLKIENLDDLWVLQNVIEQGDVVSGKTLRKIKATDKDGNVTRVSKEAVFLQLIVESAEFHEHMSMLRVAGTVQEGPEDVPKGSHHTFNLEPESIITISKEAWFTYHLQRIEEATHLKQSVLVCILDRERAIIALFEQRGQRILAELRGNAQSKHLSEQQQSTFFSDIARNIGEYARRYPKTQIVIASPAFWRDDVRKLLPDELKTRTTVASCTSATESALQELLRRPELSEALKQDRIYQETQLVEQVFEAIATGKPVAYGTKEVKRAVDSGAVNIMLVTTELLLKRHQAQTHKPLESLMRLAEKMKGEVHLIDSEHDAGKRLDSIGGIAALLRFPIGAQTTP